MAWHNHEKNIETANAFIKIFLKIPGDHIYAFHPNERLSIISLLKSFIEDSETGHKRIIGLESDINFLFNRRKILEDENERLKLKIALAMPESKPKPPLDCQALPRLLQENHELKEEAQNLKDTIRYLREERNHD